MIPKPPFACDLSLEEELAAFERLKPRLAEIWSVLTASDDRGYTSVVVPSLTLDQRELRKLLGAPYYEERLLFLLIRLRNPKAHVVYVTSQPVHPLILDYYLTLLMGIPASHARTRVGSRKEAMQQALTSLDFAVATETRESYFEKLSAMGGVVEEFLEGKHKASPSAQLRTSPDGSVVLVSTHDQILGGSSGQVYVGCSFPAHEGYRPQVQELGLRVGRVLADHGVVSRFGVDFLATRQTKREPWRMSALEILLGSRRSRRQKTL